MAVTGDISMIREFMGGPCDGLVVRVPADVLCYYLSEMGTMSFNSAPGVEQFCHVYVPDGKGRFYHAEFPIERMSDAKIVGSEQI